MVLLGSLPGKEKKSFTSRNLNALTKAPQQAATARDRYGVGGGRLLVLGKAGQEKAASVVAPTPLNTPSLRRENRGQDLSVKLVPGGGGSWAQQVPTPPKEEIKRKLAPSVSTEPPLAPWAKPERIEPEVAVHKEEECLEEEPSRDEIEDKESQTEYMRRLARQRFESRRLEEEAERAVARARAAEKLAKLEASTINQETSPPKEKAFHTDHKVQQQQPDKWQRGLVPIKRPTPSPPQYQAVQPPVRQADPVQEATVVSTTDPSRSFSSLFQKSNDAENASSTPETKDLIRPKSGHPQYLAVEREQEIPAAHISPPVLPSSSSPPRPPLAVNVDEYKREKLEAPRLFDPKTGGMYQAKQHGPRPLRIIADDTPVMQEKVPVPPPTQQPKQLLLRPPTTTTAAPPSPPLPATNNKKAKPTAPPPTSSPSDQKKKMNGTKDTKAKKKEVLLAEAQRAKRHAEKVARGPRTQGILYKFDVDGSIVMVEDKARLRNKHKEIPREKNKEPSQRNNTNRRKTGKTHDTEQKPIGSSRSGDKTKKDNTSKSPDTNSTLVATTAVFVPSASFGSDRGPMSFGLDAMSSFEAVEPADNTLLWST